MGQPEPRGQVQLVQARLELGQPEPPEPLELGQLVLAQLELGQLAQLVMAQVHLELGQLAQPEPLALAQLEQVQVQVQMVLLDQQAQLLQVQALVQLAAPPLVLEQVVMAVLQAMLEQPTQHPIAVVEVTQLLVVK